MIAEQTRSKPIARGRVLTLKTPYAVWAIGLAVAAFWMFVIWAIHWNSPRTLVSFHGLLHAAIAGQFLGSVPSSFPPENPFYAGEPVAYYWLFQYLGAQITRFSGINIFYSLEALVMIATGVLMTSAVFLGRKLNGNILTGVLMGYLIVAGTNPLGWIFGIYQLIRLGPGVLSDNSEHLWGIVHPVYSLIRYNDFGGIYGPLLNFFLNITSRPAALASLLVMILCLHSSLIGRPLSFIALGCATAITTALSPIIGITAGGALFLNLTASLFRDRRAFQTSPIEARLSMRPTLFSGAAIAAGILIAVPTYYHLLIGPSANHVTFWLFSLDGIRHIITVVLSISLLVILAFVGLIRSSKDHQRFLFMLIVSALMLLGIEAAFTLPDGNGSNLFHVAVVLLAVPAAGSIVRTSAFGSKQIVSRKLAAAIFLVFLPTSVVLAATYVNRSPLPVSFQTSTLSRVSNESDLGLLYQWARNETEPSAVFVVDPRERVAVCGNALEFPAMTSRVILTENSNHYIAQPYPDHKTRFDLAVRLTSGKKPEDTDRAFLSKFKRPIYVLVYRAGDLALMGSLREVYGAPVFNSGTVAVFQWTTTPKL